MFLELNNILNINQKNPPNDLSFVVTETKADASFVLHHFLSLYVRSGFNVCLVGLLQAQNHYRNVATKLGVDLKKSSESGKFVFIDGLKIIGYNIAGFPQVQDVDTAPEISSGFVLDERGTPSLKHVYALIKDSITPFLQEGNTPTLVLFDDISVLLTLGNTTKEVLSLVHNVKSLVLGGGSRGCLVTCLHHDSEVEDEEVNFTLKYLSHQSDCIISTRGLPSGYSRDVHGEMKIRWKNIIQSQPTPDRVSAMQYKITDKNVNFFALGTSAAVL